MNYQALKERHRAQRDAFHPNLSLRVHRALSWLNRDQMRDCVNLMGKLVPLGDACYPVVK